LPRRRQASRGCAARRPCRRKLRHAHLPRAPRALTRLHRMLAPPCRLSWVVGKWMDVNLPSVFSRLGGVGLRSGNDKVIILADQCDVVLCNINQYCHVRLPFALALLCPSRKAPHGQRVYNSSFNPAQGHRTIATAQCGAPVCTELPLVVAKQPLTKEAIFF
jgi:hypothetical protein